ncbi:hypothetical protein [Longimicrobium sp.]|uniref:hypothetical protein n=1 Tax=Longimicrobium sp. TaxID=2029185 RepID=UPI003B3B3C4E
MTKPRRALFPAGVGTALVFGAESLRAEVRCFCRVAFQTLHQRLPAPALPPGA